MRPSPSRPTSVASYQSSSSPRLSSPLGPSPNSPPHSSPASEMSDTLSPLRERVDPAVMTTSPAHVQPRTCSFSRSPLAGASSPERSPVAGSMPHRAYARHPSPSTTSAFAQGIPFPSSPPLASSPFAGHQRSPSLRSPRPLSPASGSSPRQTSPPASIHPRSHFHSPPLHYSPPQPAQSHFCISQGLPVQIVASPSARYHRTQSLIQRSFGDPYAAQAASSPQEAPRNRRVSLGAESRPHPSTWASTLVSVKGDSTPLNQAPIRWWGGRPGWADDDWDALAQHSQTSIDPHAAALISAHDELDPLSFVPHGHGNNPLAFREPFGRGRGAFLDDEIRASFDGGLGTGSDFAGPVTPRHVCVSIGASVGYEMDGVALPRAAPVPMPQGGARSRMRREDANLIGGQALVDGMLAVQKSPDNAMRQYRGSPGAFAHDGTKVQETGHGTPGHEHVVERNRRFSDASTRSSTSYASCVSQSHSQSLVVSPSQSHTSTCPSLSSLGIGIEEAEREELRSRTFWRRKNSASIIKRQSKHASNGTCGHSEQGEPIHADGASAGAVERQDVDSKQFAKHAQERETVKHGSLFHRINSKQGDALQETALREGYNTAEKYVSLAITSILPATTIMMLSPVGEALIKARESVKFVGHELAPVVKDTLSVSTDILSFAPLPGLEDAAKALLSVWNACQMVDTNRLSCLRLAERCATLLCSVRCEINEAGAETAMGLAEPVDQLCDALFQIRTFLETQLHRPFLKRYVKREEIGRELVACNQAITDAASRFGISVQIRTFHVVCLAASESRRFVQEAQALLSLDQQMMQRHYAMMCAQPVQAWRHDVVAAGFSNDNALGLTMGEEGGYDDDGGGGYLMPLTSHPTTGKQMSAGSGPESGRNTPTSSILSTGYPSDSTESTVSVPPTPTPTRSTFVVEETRTKVETAMTVPSSPMRALAQVRCAQDSVDAAVDNAALRGTLAGALDARCDVAMVRCLQVARGEIPEATVTLRRLLDAGAGANTGTDGKESVASNGEESGTELHRKFMQSGIEAMSRLASVAMDEPRDASDSEVEDLPSWTITRYEVIRRRKIGAGFFSDVYFGRWRNKSVVIKVLAHGVSRDAFVRHVEQWNALDHANVLPLYGASSAVGEKPWFLVTKFCSGGGLVASLKSARTSGATTVEDETIVRVDPLRCMYEIAAGMSYLHGRGVLHGDLRAANVLVDEDGRCVLSDFGQWEVKSEARLSSSRSEPLERGPTGWKAPEILESGDPPTNAADVYAFGMCCVEILGMGEHPWATFDDGAIRELVIDQDARPPIPALAGDARVADAIASLVRSCWVREPDCRPSFASVADSLERLLRLGGRDDVRQPSTPLIRICSAAVFSAESSPADDLYETASESMLTDGSGMVDVSLASPGPGDAATGGLERGDEDMIAPGLSLMSGLDAEARNEANYRRIVGSNHAFHGSLTLPLWTPTRVELGAVGYHAKPRGEFVTLLNAIDPLQSCEERVRELPSMYGYGKIEMQKREEGKRSVAQRGLDAISGFLTLKTRGDRWHPERIARQYSFPVERGKAAAHLCVERTVHRYMDHERLEAPRTWLSRHADVVVDVYGARHGIRREDVILVVGTLDAHDWALFASEDHVDGRAQFSVYAGREKGEAWGVYTMEGAAKDRDDAVGVEGSKVSVCGDCPSAGSGDAVMLAGLRLTSGRASVVSRS